MANVCETQGLFGWFELLTSDVEGAKSFYSQLFGWTFSKDTNSPIDYTLVSLDGVQKPFAGIYHHSSAMVESSTPIPPHWGNYITVVQIDEKVQMVTQLGGTIILPCTDIPNVGRFSLIQDPQGAIISLFEYIGCESHCEESASDL